MMAASNPGTKAMRLSKPAITLFIAGGLASFAFASPALSQDDDGRAVEAPGKITDRSHPDYVRCRTERVIGSLAKRRKVCLTNSEWARVAREGNQFANELVSRSRGEAERYD